MANPGARKQIVPLAPDSDAGREAADALSEVLARVELRLRGRNNASKANTGQPDCNPAWSPE